PPPPPPPLFPYTTLFRSIANSVNSIARSVGMSLGTAFVVTMVTRNLIPGAPLPREAQYVWIFIVGAAIALAAGTLVALALPRTRDRKSTRLNSSHVAISY